MVEPSDTSFEQLPLAAKRRIDAVCARFEERWQEGKPVLEPFVEGAPAEERPVLLAELLHIDLECRRRAGESPRAEDYLFRFPGLEAIIRGVLADDAKNQPDRVETAQGPRETQPGTTAIVTGRASVQVPGYEVLEEIGRGGMGVVYKARHLALNRMVALKFILAGGQANARQQERFRREAEVVARLRHPNIVQIYDIGEVNGQVYLALEYAEGGSLRERLAGEPMPPRAAAVLLEAIARAVQHAHRQGVVHRDLKPANVLLTVGGDSIAAGNRPLPEWRPLGIDLPRSPDALPPVHACTPKLTDFGLAKVLDREGPGTDPGLAAGTPSYMAPEQATASATNDPLVDVWALGATLYELLTGRPPFRAASAVETMRLVLEADPVPPRQLQPSVPRDLETICLKCLDKDPARRYAGARELAQDLRHFLQGEPIEARPMGRIAYAMRWARRQPGTATLVVLLVLSLLLGAAGVAFGIVYAVSGWRQADRDREEIATEHARAERNAQEARQAQERAEHARRETQRLSAELLLARARALGEHGRPDEALHALLEGLRQAPPDDDGLHQALRTNLSAWRGHLSPLVAVFAAEENPTYLAVSPDSKQLYTARRGRTRLRDLATGRQLRPDWEHEGTVSFLAFDSEGTQLLVGESAEEGKAISGMAYFRDPRTGEKRGAGLPHGGTIHHGLFLPGNKEVLTACGDGKVRRWTVADRRLQASLEHPLPPRWLALSRDGKRLAVALGDLDGRRGAVHLWDLSVDRPTPIILPHPDGVATVAFHPDGRLLGTGCGDGLVRLWEVGKWERPLRTLWHPGGVRQLEWTADGRGLLVATTEQAVRLWDLPSGRQLSWFQAGTLPFARIDEGRRLVLGGSTEVRIHVLARPASRPASLPGALASWSARPAVTSADAIAYLPDGKRVLVGEAVEGRARGVARLRTLDTGQPIGTPWLHRQAGVTQVRLDPTGRRLATATEDPEGGVWLWEAATGKRLHGPFGPKEPITALAFSHDGSRLLLGGRSGSLSAWDSATGAALGPAIRHQAPITDLAASSDGRWLAVGLARSTGSVVLRDAARLEVAGLPLEQPGPTRRLRFSPHGRTLLVLGETARLWDSVQRQPISLPLWGVSAGVFRQDGESVYLGSSDGSVRHLNVRTGAVSGPLLDQDAPVETLALSPDGEYLLVAGHDGCAWLYGLRGRARLLGPPFVHGSPILTAAFAGNGQSFLTTGADGLTRRWQMPRPEEGNLESLTRLVEVLTGHAASAGESLLPLSAEGWSKRARQQALPVLLELDKASWHAVRASDAEQDGDLFAAGWHLDCLLRLRPQDRTLQQRRGLLHARHQRFDLAAAALQGVSDWENGLASSQALGDWRAALWYIGLLLKERPGDVRLLEERRAAQRQMGETPMVVPRK